MIILIMGLPGSGKTTLARNLKDFLEKNNKVVEWFNADTVRKEADDWDFSEDGRIRQAARMKNLARSSKAEFVICDFIAPLETSRRYFNQDWLIWMDTIDKSVYEDTNKIFQEPTDYDFRITEKNSVLWSDIVGGKILLEDRPTFDYSKETVQLLGRWQSWHLGHRMLFERALEKTGQVIIMIRACKHSERNPYSPEEIEKSIRRDLDPLYQGLYEVMVVPDIVNITYGRGVGYKIEEEVLPDSIQKISATKIRNDKHYRPL